MPKNETENLEVDDNLENTEDLQVEEEDNKEPKTKESVIEKIKNKISNFVNPDSKEEEGDDVPDDFVKAARSLNWSDEDIVEFAADYDDETLLEMIPSLNAEEPSDSDDTPQDKDVDDKEKDKDSQDDEQIQKLLERIAALEKAQEKDNEALEQKKIEESVQRASQMFDEAGKEFAVFGKTEDLPKFPDGRIVPNSPQMKARNEVWDVATRLQDAGMDFDTAMSVSLNAFKGKNLATEVKRNIIKGLKKNESKLSGKRTTHESSKVPMSGADVIREVARKHGKEIL